MFPSRRRPAHGTSARRPPQEKSVTGRTPTKRAAEARLAAFMRARPSERLRQVGPPPPGPGRRARGGAGTVSDRIHSAGSASIGLTANGRRRSARRRRPQGGRRSGDSRGGSVRYRKRAMIVAPQPEAAEAGAEILKAGGNAVDSAIACALVQGVVDPLMCGIAGFGSCAIAMRSGFHGYVDFHAPAPLAVRPDMWADRIEAEARDGYGFILRGRVNDIGYQSICVPASLRAYRDAHREHGRLPWEQIVEPAIAWAEDGWTVRPHVATWWAEDDQMGRAANHERL